MKANENDPVRTITFVGGGARPREHYPRRTGRPKHKWAIEESKRVWEAMQRTRQPKIPYDIQSQEQGNEILEFARAHKKARK